MHSEKACGSHALSHDTFAQFRSLFFSLQSCSSFYNFCSMFNVFGRVNRENKLVSERERRREKTKVCAENTAFKHEVYRKLFCLHSMLCVSPPMVVLVPVVASTNRFSNRTFYAQSTTAIITMHLLLDDNKMFELRV